MNTDDFQDRADKAMQDPRRAPQPDRAAIEALARELTDDGWDEYLTGVPHNRSAEFPAAPLAFGTPPALQRLADDVWRVHLNNPTRRALLAYLDEVWAGLTSARKGRLMAAHDCDSLELERHRGSALDGLQATGLLVKEKPHRLSPTWLSCTPLGRAVLKRAKEQGRG